MIAYQQLKRLELLLPAVVRQPLRTAWRAVRGTPEEHIAAHLSDPLKIAIDVGASTGFLAGTFAKHARACLAFEPNPASAAVLQRK